LLHDVLNKTIEALQKKKNTS